MNKQDKEYYVENDEELRPPREYPRHTLKYISALSGRTPEEITAETKKVRDEHDALIRSKTNG